MTLGRVVLLEPLGDDEPAGDHGERGGDAGQAPAQGQAQELVGDARWSVDGIDDDERDRRQAGCGRQSEHDVLGTALGCPGRDDPLVAVAAAVAVAVAGLVAGERARAAMASPKTTPFQIGSALLYPSTQRETKSHTPMKRSSVAAAIGAGVARRDAGVGPTWLWS